jgi:hypothetical protein
LGGASPLNDINIRVTNVDSGGAITSFTFTGTAVTGGATYTSVSQSSTSGIGSAATLDVTRVGGTGNYSVITVASGGADYAPGDTVTFSGTNFGGASPANDIQILVGGVTAGSIVDYTIVGSPIGASGDASYPAEPASNIPNSGANALFTVTRTSGSYSAVATDIGTGYVAGNRIVIAGTSLSGTSPSNDCTLTVLSVGGGLMTVTATGTPYSGDLLSIFPTMTISEPLNSA